MTKPARFSQADLDRIFRAAKKAGVEVSARIKPDGEIIVLTGEGEAANDANPWDKVLP